MNTLDEIRNEPPLTALPEGMSADSLIYDPDAFDRAFPRRQRHWAAMLAVVEAAAKVDWENDFTWMTTFLGDEAKARLYALRDAVAALKEGKDGD